MYITIIYTYRAPVKIPYMRLVAVVMVIAFGGPYRFRGFCGNQHTQHPTWSKNLFPNKPGHGSRRCFVGFRCCGNIPCSFYFACVPCHVPFIILQFVFISLHFPFMFLQCAFVSIHLPFVCKYLHAISVHFVFMSLHFLSKVLETALWLGQGRNATNERKK